MIKALILFHACSLLVAVCVWVFQSDRQGRIGNNFPSPFIWLISIGFCFVPGVLSTISFGLPARLPSFEFIEGVTQFTNEEGFESLFTFNFVALYFGLSFLLLSQTLWQWFRLQCLQLKTTTDPQVFTIQGNLPPLTLSLPRRAIVIPQGLEDSQSIIRHERVHLRHADAEVTLGLLLLRDVMLRNVGFSYLVRQWRLAIELRADFQTTKMLTLDEKRNYAVLLLHGLQSGGDHVDGHCHARPPISHQHNIGALK